MADISDVRPGPTPTQSGPRPPVIQTSTSGPSGNICAVTPSQVSGSLDNIISRLEAIEAVLSSLLGGDVTANQLSDISGAAGVVTDLVATASNAAGGWTTDGTFSGVAISTLGWVMSTGQSFPIVSMINGVLQYGFDETGLVGGDEVSNALFPIGRYFSSLVSSAASSPAFSPYTWTTDISSEHFVNNGNGVVIQSNGIYMLIGHGTSQRPFATDDTYTHHRIGVQGQLLNENVSVGLRTFHPTPLGAGVLLSAYGVVVARYTAGQTIVGEVSKTGTPQLSASATFTIMKLSANQAEAESEA